MKHLDIICSDVLPSSELSDAITFIISLFSLDLLYRDFVQDLPSPFLGWWSRTISVSAMFQLLAQNLSNICLMKVQTNCFAV